MPITFTIDAAAQRVFARVEGTFDITDIRRVLLNVAGSEELRDGFTVLSDHTTVERAISPDQLFGLVRTLETRAERFRGVRWAVVVNRPSSYGMMRMMAAQADMAVGMQVGVFMDQDAAAAWLAEGADG